MSESNLPPTPTVDQWAIVELLGHVSYGAKLSSEQIAGVSLVRLDIPGDLTELLVPKFVGSGAIYAITVCDEPYARAYQQRYGQSPLRNLPKPAPEQSLCIARKVPEYDADDDPFDDCDPWDDADTAA